MRKSAEERKRRRRKGDGKVNAPILSTPSLKLLLFTAPFFLCMLSVTSKWAKSPMCVYASVRVCLCPPG